MSPLGDQEIWSANGTFSGFLQVFLAHKTREKKKKQNVLCNHLLLNNNANVLLSLRKHFNNRQEWNSEHHNLEWPNRGSLMFCSKARCVIFITSSFRANGDYRYCEWHTHTHTHTHSLTHRMDPNEEDCLGTVKTAVYFLSSSAVFSFFFFKDS